MARHDQNKALMIEMLTLLNRIESALVVRDPGSKISADAYDGLRKMLLQSSKNRRIHVSHLLSLSDSLNRNASMQLIKDRVADYMAELGISYWTDTSIPDLFDVIEGEGEVVECIEPAVVEKLEDGRIIEVRRGIARRIPGPETEPVSDPDIISAISSEDSSDEDPGVSTGYLEVKVAKISPRQKVFAATVVLVSVLVGFAIGLIASAGSDRTPARTRTTVASSSTSPKIDTPVTTTSEAGK